MYVCSQKMISKLCIISTVHWETLTKGKFGEFDDIAISDAYFVLLY